MTKPYALTCPDIVGINKAPFNRNTKPHIELWHSPPFKRRWIVTRDYSIKWKHLTIQEQSNILAAYDYVNRRNLLG